MDSIRYMNVLNVAAPQMLDHYQCQKYLLPIVIGTRNYEATQEESKVM